MVGEISDKQGGGRGEEEEVGREGVRKGGVGRGEKGRTEEKEGRKGQ